MTATIQNSTPVETIKTFIASIQTKDTESMRKLIHPQATACLIRPPSDPRFQTLTAAIEVLAQSEQEFVEESWDEVEHVDGEYATVWARFSIHRDGEASHLFRSRAVARCSMPIIRFAAPSTRVELLFVLEKP